jgi:hypothetical protein
MERPESSIDPMKHFAYAREHRKATRRKIFWLVVVALVSILLIGYRLYVGLHDQYQLQPQHPISALFSEEGNGARFLLPITTLTFVSKYAIVLSENKVTGSLRQHHSTLKEE